MAQVVIFAPSGEDVSAGEAALKEAGHDVEVVEATAANLLHMAIGMVGENAEAEPTSDEPVTEPTEEPSEDAAPEEEAEAPPTTEALGEVEVDGEAVTAYLDRSRSFPLLRVVDLTGDKKLSYKLNESAFTFWRNAGGAARVSLNLVALRQKVVESDIGRSAGPAFIILDQGTAKAVGLV